MTWSYLLRATRLLPGARSCWVAVLAAGSLAVPAWSRPAEEARPLPWRVGGAVGFTVDVAAFPDSSGTMLEVYVRIPPATLEGMARDSLGAGRLALTTRLTLPTGGRMPERRQELEFDSTAVVPGFGKVVVVRYPTRPGRHRLVVRLEDINSLRTGLGYFGRPRSETATIQDDFEVPRPQGDREISDLEFVWTSPDSGGTAFQRAGGTRLPDPDRLYGLFASDLRAFFVARGRAGDARAWRWQARALDAGGQPHASQEGLGAAGVLLAAECRLDLSTLPAGGYDLEVRAWQEGDAAPLVRSAHFNVAWRPTTWHRNPGEVEDEVHLLLDQEQEERFARLQPGEQERELDDYWAKRDPTPGTATNEARETFVQRVDQANVLYTRRGSLRGMFTDMGRVYIRYGEPSEVSHQVIPAGAETLQQVLEEIEAADKRPTGDVNQKGPGGDERPYEVWVYEAPVNPPLDADPGAMRVPLQRRVIFLFVDQQQLGNYTLRYSTE
jgi:GWxTD domain-containing protein